MMRERPESARPDGTEELRKHSRRKLLGTAGVGAAGIVAGATLGRAAPAAAADGSPLVIGQLNTGTVKTELDTSGTIASDGAFVVSAPNADFGLIGDGSSVGVVGSAVIGVFGAGTVGGIFSGTDSAVNFAPRTTPGPTSSAAFKGDVAVDSEGVLWLCIADGTPGNWIRVSHGGIRMLDSPQRAYDSRFSGGPLNADETRTIPVRSVISGVPSEAGGFVGNLTIVNTVGLGFLVGYPAGTPRPATSNINWFQSNQIIANSAAIRFGTSGQISIYVSGSTNVIVDVAGYIL
jgi:hypothetical protein